MSYYVIKFLKKFSATRVTQLAPMSAARDTVEARKNSRVAAAVFASHRMSLELDATTKAENARLLDPTASLLLTPDPDELALEFEQHLHTQISTMSPSEAFSIRERSTGRRSRADSATLLADLRRESNDSVLSHMNRPTGVELNEAISELENVGCCARFWTFVESMSRRALFLVILGLLSGLVAVLINVCIRWLIEAGLHIATNSKAAFVAYVFYTIFLVGLSLAITRFLSPLAAGSGIPEMKSILSGARMPQYLGIRTLITKIIGSILAVGGNLTVGQEGPFVHIASAIAHIMMRLRFFSVLGASDHYRQQMLSIGCALGIAASFGAPFGGMLYAIETTSTYYPMDGYFPSFFACVVGAFTYRYVWNAASGQQYWISMLQTQYPRVGVDIRFWDMLLFAVLGLLLAGAGILLISLFARLAAWRNSLHAYYWQGPNQPSTTTTTTSTSSSTANTEFVSLEDRPERTQEPVYTSENFAPFSQADSGAAAAAAAVAASTTLPWYQRLFLSPYAYSLAIVLVTAVLNFPGLIGDFMGSSTHDALQAMFGTANMNDPVAMAAQSPMAKDWNTGGGVYFNLLLFGVIRLLLCSLSITLPLPAGMFMPCMAIGGAFGRCFGNIASVAFGASIAPGVFSVSGAAAMVAATTHSLSTILILLEVTGQLYFAYPVTVCVLMALFVSRRFTKSIYETIIESRHLPYLPTLKDRDVDRSISAMMEECHVSVPKLCTVSTMIRVLSKDEQSVLPVVAGADNKYFVGTIERKHLEKCVIDALRSALRELDSTLIEASSSSEAEVTEQTISAARVEELSAQRDLLTRLCKTALDPMHKRVIVRRDIDYEPLLRPMAAFERPIELQFESTPVRFLRDTTVAHAHVLFILFRLEFAFVTEAGELCGQISRGAFVNGIHGEH